jgi:hypothetical protein
VLGTVGGSLATVLVAQRSSAAIPALWLWVGSLAALAAHVVRGWWVSGTGWKGIGALLSAPLYVAWKLRLLLSSPQHDKAAWLRTPRDK